MSEKKRKEGYALAAEILDAAIVEHGVGLQVGPWSVVEEVANALRQASAVPPVVDTQTEKPK